MPKLTRYYQKIFGSSAGADEMAKFGSLSAGSPETYSGSTITPTIVQQLSNYLGGWFDGVVGGYSPSIEDMNALFYLCTYQLSYLMEQGIPEWDASTTYYIGSLAKDSSGNIYVSLTDNNLNNALSSATNWKLPIASKQIKFEVNGPYYTGGSTQTALVYEQLTESRRITGSRLSVQINGTSGSLTIDIKSSSDYGATWSSIFTTKPTISAASGNFATSTAGVLANTATVFTTDTIFRLDIDAIPGGVPNGFVVTLESEAG